MLIGSDHEKITLTITTRQFIALRKLLLVVYEGFNNPVAYDILNEMKAASKQHQRKKEGG